MVADLAEIITGIILANLSASFVEGLDMKLRGVTTGLIQVLLVQPPFLKIVVVLVLISAKHLLIPQLCLQHLRCSMITLGTLILVLQITPNANNLQHNTEFTGQDEVHIGDGLGLSIS